MAELPCACETAFRLLVTQPWTKSALQRIHALTLLINCLFSGEIEGERALSVRFEKRLHNTRLATISETYYANLLIIGIKNIMIASGY